jgi:2-polyprenyl-3-methyl-5-hydroxy-6-metoxy-1,4-benzoquinol methylase
VTLLSGERQVAPTVAGIRGDHVARYRFAAARWGEGAAVLDAGCGIGYGARLLAEAGAAVYAWDVDAEAIAYARAHYEHRAIRWSVADLCEVTCRQATHAIAFEILEHLARPGAALVRFPDQLIASMPNGAIVPKMPGRYVHHVRHYTPEELACLLAGAGYQVAEWWSQTTTEDGPLVPGTRGRTIIAVAER